MTSIHRLMDTSGLGKGINQVAYDVLENCANNFARNDPYSRFPIIDETNLDGLSARMFLFVRCAMFGLQKLAITEDRFVYRLVQI